MDVDSFEILHAFGKECIVLWQACNVFLRLIKKDTTLFQLTSLRLC